MTVAELIENLKEMPQDAILINKYEDVLNLTMIEDRLLLSGYSEYKDTVMLLDENDTIHHN